MVRSEGNMSLKNPVTPQGIDAGTIRLVAQRLNHYATPGPRLYYTSLLIIRSINNGDVLHERSFVTDEQIPDQRQNS